MQITQGGDGVGALKRGKRRLEEAQRSRVSVVAIKAVNLVILQIKFCGFMVGCEEWKKGALNSLH